MIDCPRLGSGTYLQRPLVHLVFYYMSSINGAMAPPGGSSGLLLRVAPQAGSLWPSRSDLFDLTGITEP